MNRKFLVFCILSLVLAVLISTYIFKYQLPTAKPTTELIVGLEAFFILTLLVEIFSIPLLSGASTISVVPPVIWAMIVLFGPFYTIIIAVVSNFIYDYQVKKVHAQRIIASTAQYIIMISLSGMIFTMAGGNIGQQKLSELLIPFILGISVYFLLFHVFSSLHIAFSENTSPYYAWVINYRWMIPYELALIPFSILIIFIYQQLNLVGLLLLLVPLLMIRRSYSLNIDLKKTYKETVQAFIRTIEAHDSYTSGHSFRVAKYSLQLAQKIRLPFHEIEKLEISAYLHDIGKIANFFSGKILNNKKKLDQEQYDLKETHLHQSEHLISGVSFLKEVGAVIKYHHEKWDGTGYPEGLSGEEIPRLSRILSIADAFDAMTSDRSYRKAMSVSEAIEELEKNSGSQFDPILVELFINKCINIEKDSSPGKLIEDKRVLANSEISLKEKEGNKKIN